ncbi:SRPBCC family protein [Cucumibacter marinus]|uniref:SRPBCC family protein n=1 Tax=Cucumibacter marinus TaxID=1121252 RepID=UPI00041B138D|nr:SRPBCC domain-containing protein [Cucumibacter marinus]
MSETIHMRRLVRAPRPRVFEAWTRAEHITRWWGPGEVTCPHAEVDLSVGGRYRIDNREPDGTIITITGTYEEIEEPNRLVYSWFLGETPDKDSGTRVTVEFNEHDEGTEVVVTHERLPDIPTRDMHAQGWAGCLDGLVAYFD